MIKMMTRAALVAALAVGVLGFSQVVRAEEKPAAAAPAKEKAMDGKIEAVDTTANTVTLKHGKKETTVFTVNANTKYTGAGDKSIVLADLKVGDRVKVHYTEDGGKFVASHIGHVAPKKEKPAAN